MVRLNRPLGTRRPAPYRRAANAANTLKQPYHPTTAQVAIPIEIKPLPTRAGQPVSLPGSALRTSIATPRRASRRRHAGTDQARHSAVQATATTAINAAVVYRTMSEFTTFLRVRRTIPRCYASSHRGGSV